MNHRKTRDRWRDMMRRCYNPRNRQYPRNGMCGIQVNPRWHTYENFLADMGHPPHGTRLYRKDIGKDYGPGNCEWQPFRQTFRNRRNSRRVGHLTIIDVARQCQLATSTVYYRFDHGWTLEQCLANPGPVKRYVPPPQPKR